jgi:tetraacyldisaccharide 4'-kinase
MNTKKELPPFGGILRRVLFPLLWPLSLIYGGVLWFRNKLFAWGWLKSKRYPLPVISIGNITVGGTGKTPLTEYVIRLLKPTYSLALLSRGYKRETKGVIIAAPKSTAEEIGDEPKQILSKFPDISVAVAEKRTEGIERLINYCNPDTIVMDDAYQHRYVQPGFSILIIDYYRPLWKDYPFPAGYLREPRSGKKRADVIVINKCPANLSQEEKEEIKRKIKPHSGQHLFFTSIEYQRPVSFTGGDDLLDSDVAVLALAGISHPKTFIDYLSQTFSKVYPLIFPDHQPYSKSKKEYSLIKGEFEKITNSKKVIITTEKDMIRLRNIPWLDDNIKQYLWYIPIKLSFLFDEEKIFNQLIKSYVEKDKRDR